MGALGQAIKTQVEALIDDPNLRSNATVNSITFSEGSYGGYSAGTATTTGTALVYAIPSNYVQTRMGLQPYGDLQEGELRILIKESETIDNDSDTVTFNSETFKVREIKPIYFNEEIIAKGIILTKNF